MFCCKGKKKNEDTKYMAGNLEKWKQMSIFVAVKD